MELDDTTPLEQINATAVEPPQAPPPDQEIIAANTVPLQPLVERLTHLEQALDRLSAETANLGERTGMIPPQIRQLRERVDNITESISQPRIRDLLNGLLLLYDLAESLANTTEPGSVHVRNYQVLCDQILQILRINGVNPIAEVQRFDPYQHKAIETIPCPSPEEDDLIAHCHRTGFRTDHGVLRYAEVSVKRYQSPNVEEEQT